MHVAKTRYPLGNRFWSAYSLRTRYLAVTGLVALIIMTGALLAQSYMERASEMRSHNLKLRNDVSLLNRLLRGSMLDVERNLNAFLRLPTTDGQSRVDEALAQTITYQKRLYELDWFKNSNMVVELDDFGSDLQGLQVSIDHLMERRLADRGHKSQSRSATPIVATNIEQQFVHIWEYLQLIDVKLENLSSSDIASLTTITDSTAKALWLLALAGIALLAIGAIYFERSILAPITQVARALRAEAHGEPHTPLPDAQSRETHHLIEAFNEMHHQVQQRQQSLEHLAMHDTLTGLANREQLVRAIDKTLTASVASERPLALLMIGLDRFKEINNSLGHSVGDRLLIAVAQRLTLNNPADTLIVRLNGDGFAMLLTGSKSQEAVTLAEEVIRVLESPFEVESQSLYISATIGIAFSPEHGNRPLELLQKAEVAMQVAKQQTIKLTSYNSEHDRHAMHRLALANALRQELLGPKDTLSLVYQPQIEIPSGKVCGIEALLRWNAPREGSIAPDELIPIAEQTGLIYQLTPWVIERAFQEFSSLKQYNGVKPVLAVNLSVLNLHDAEFPHRLQHLMEKWAIDPATLQLEITESAMMSDPERAHRTLDHIHSLGVDLTIDDFGTGFSSLTYLKHLPVNKLKIDKSFVISMLQDENDAVIIRSTIDMAHNLGMKVVAEGVENQETYDLLEILDCDIAQGYLISTPLDLATLETWIPLQQRLATSPPLHSGQSGLI